jgi:hypothetical protein
MKRRVAHKVGSVVVEAMKQGRLPLSHLQSSKSVAKEVNKLLKCQAVSGAQLNNAVKAGRVNQSPPRFGKPTEIPHDDFINIACLLYTAAAIEQANADPKRMNRQDEIQLVGKIINGMRRLDGKEPMDEVAFHLRLELQNSTKPDVEVVDKREQRRVLWLTYHNAKRNHEKWEAAWKEKGFAWSPANDQEQKEKGHVVFHDQTFSRIVNLDEMKLPLSGTDDSGMNGGQPSITKTTAVVQESGKAVDSTSACCTLVAGIIGFEAMPPLFIFPSSSKASFTKVQAKSISSFKQVIDRYDYLTPLAHDCTIAKSEKGSMTQPIFDEWMNERVIQCWPNMSDNNGKRVMLKADSGPGRHSASFTCWSKVEGLCYFPDLPQGTEVGQEMDQLFSAFQNGCNINRRKIYHERCRVQGAKATLTLEDVGHIVFSGELQLGENQPPLLLEDVFAKYLSPQHIRAACEKVGYYPATRRSLENALVCGHELIENADGEIDEYADATGVMLDLLEKENHRAVAVLIEAGYLEATEGKRHINRRTAAQVTAHSITRTAPLSRERQDMLQKHCTTAGSTAGTVSFTE